MINIDTLVAACHDQIVDYDQAYHIRKYLELSSTGMMIYDIALEFGVTLDVMQAWTATYREFGKAVEIGRQLAISFYLNRLSRMGSTGAEYKALRYFLDKVWNVQMHPDFRKMSLSEQAIEISKLWDRNLLTQDKTFAHLEVINKIADIDDKSRVREFVDEHYDEINEKLGGR